MELDVLVVGAGPVGLAAGLFLARQGLSVRIIDKSDGPAKESRAIGIQARTLEVLDMAAAAGEFLAQGHRVHGVCLYGEHGSRIGRIGFDALPSRFNCLITFPQNDTERVLADRLAEHGIHVERRTTLCAFAENGTGIAATVELADGTKEELPCGWLIGADGAHSTVRQLLGMRFAGKTYDLKFLLVDLHIKTELTDQDAHVFAKTEGMFAMFPLGGGRFRLVADNPPGQFSENCKPTLDEWQALVNRRAAMPMRLSEPNWTAYFRVNARMVEHLRKGRAFLMGDAAHIHSPALAQGMNTGIHDAWNLAWKLALVHRGLAPPALLDSYEAERLPVERRVLAMTDFAQSVVATDSRTRQVLRDLLVPIATHLPFVQEKAGRTVSQLAVGYHDSPIIEDHPVGGVPPAGNRAPDALMVDSDGDDVWLMSLFGTRHVLLVMNVDPRDPAAGVLDVARQAADRFGQVVNVYTIGAINAPSTAPAATLKPKDGTFRERYGAAAAYVLVRPDGYVAFRSDATHPQHLLDFLSRQFKAE